MTKKTTQKAITSITKLRELTNKEAKTFWLVLNHGLYSKKKIKYNTKTKTFSILNFIDDSRQKLTEKQMNNQKFTNIGLAIKKHALILEK